MRPSSQAGMRRLTAPEMRAINGGEMSTECGIAVGFAVASWFLAPMLTLWAVEGAVAVCATT
jgi:hypothetical protein